jgi:hypothetical protein
LVEDEEFEKGSVSLDVYRKFLLMFLGGWLGMAMFVGMTSLQRALESGWRSSKKGEKRGCNLQ